MTCIVGWVTSALMIMAADSAACTECSIRIRRDPKLFRATLGGQPALLGFMGSYRLGQLLIARRSSLASLTPVGHDVFDWMLTEFVPFIRDQWRAGGHTKVDSNRESTEGSILVAVAGRLFEIHGDLQVSETRDPFTATGCGRDGALAALVMAQRLGVSPRDAIDHVLATVEYLNLHVRAPFVVEEVEVRP